jgi:amino acid adenylation domain-containing protein
MAPLQTFLEATAARHGARIALSLDDSVLTYAELDAGANRVANSLIRHGVRVGDRVALWMPKSIEAIVSIWGILKAGAALVPVDPAAPVSRLATIARDCETRAVIAGTDRADDIQNEFGGAAPMRAVLYSGAGSLTARGAQWSSATWNEIQSESAAPPPVRIDDAALAVVQYTSGSTGAPKGAAIPHRALVTQAEWTVSALGLSCDDRLPGYTPLSSSMSTFEIFAGALAGASVYPVSPRLAPFPAAVAKSWSEQRVTAMYVVASVLQMLLNRGNLGGLDFSALRLILVGGEHMPAQRLAELMGLLPQARFVIAYGRTEAKVRSIHEVPYPPKEIDTRTIGRIGADTRLFIFDEEQQPVADGEIGELWIAGPGLMIGYYGLPEMTAEVISTVKPGPDESVLACRTGDLARRHADGTLELLGRADHQVKVRGYRVETGEIETALCRHLAVHAAVVLAIPDPETGNRLKAVVVLKTGSDAGEDTLRDHCAEQLPPYMVPESIEFRTSIPLMSNGKVDRRALRESSARPAPKG